MSKENWHVDDQKTTVFSKRNTKHVLRKTRKSRMFWSAKLQLCRVAGEKQKCPSLFPGNLTRHKVIYAWIALGWILLAESCSKTVSGRLGILPSKSLTPAKKESGTPICHVVGMSRIILLKCLNMLTRAVGGVLYKVVCREAPPAVQPLILLYTIWVRFPFRMLLSHTYLTLHPCSKLLQWSWWTILRENIKHY